MSRRPALQALAFKRKPPPVDAETRRLVEALARADAAEDYQRAETARGAK